MPQGLETVRVSQVLALSRKAFSLAIKVEGDVSLGNPA